MTQALIPLDRRTALLHMAQMAEIESLVLASGISRAMLMENVGCQVAQAIVSRWTPRPVLVLCGPASPGGHGGDGFVVAGCLAQANWPVRVALCLPQPSLCGQEAVHAQFWRGTIEPLTPGVLEGAELVVDAVLGRGLSQALPAAVAQTLAQILAQAALKKLTVVAVDMPSGLSADTGQNFPGTAQAGGAVACALTVTFFRKKPGHLLHPGRRLCGELVVSDIGIPAAMLDQVRPNTFENDPCLWREALPVLLADSHKYARGHALVWGGWPTTGAARMAARAAARVGAGLTTVAVAEAALLVYAVALTSVMVSPIRQLEDLENLLSDIRISGLLIGPGTGVGSDTRARVLAMLKAARATVLDADALTTFKDEPQVLFSAIEARGLGLGASKADTHEWGDAGNVVLTPHEGEFTQLFKGVVDLQSDKLTRARMAAQVSGAIVVLKGSDTVIAAPNGLAIINTNAPPSLATAGSGDVLAGMLLGLLAQGMPPFLAAAAAVWLHAAAAEHFGPGLVAEDLPEALPAVFRSLDR